MTTATKTKHTPGPWKLGTKAHEHMEGNNWRVAVFADNANPGDKIPGEGFAKNRVQARANARLIAAAPDLLAACKEAKAALAFAAFEDEECSVAACADAWNSLRAAIVAAES